MFAENLLESSGTQRTRRGWTTAASVTVQAAVLSLFVLVPLLYPSALSIAHPEAISIPLFSPAAAPITRDTPRPQSGPASPSTNAPFVPVRETTLTFGEAKDRRGDTQIQPTIGLSIPGAGPFIPTSGPGPRVDLARPEKPIAISHMDAGSLIHDVKPVYPRIAVLSHTEGVVILHALISREGTIESLQLVSGHPMLANAALDAVRQWRYRPYILNGEAVEVETQVTVNFKLGGN